MPASFGRLLQHDVADGVDVERSAERLTEHHEALQFGRAPFGLNRARLRGGGLLSGLLTPPLQVVQKDDRENNQRRHERQAGGPLDVARQVQQVADRSREHHNKGDGETGQQDSVLTTDKTHGIIRL